MRAARVTPGAKAMTDRLEAARERMARHVFASWEAHDVEELVHLMGKFAAAMSDPPRFRQDA